MAYYSIKQVSNITKLPPHVLRYYEKEGLLPSVQRSEGGIRRYSDQDLELLSIICCLKNTGMSLRQIKGFMSLSQQGDETLKQRCDMLAQHRNGVEKHIREMEEHLFMVNRKLQFFWDLYQAYQHEQERMAVQMKEVFSVQVKRYPQLMPQDAVKLLYQNEFGGGHIIANRESSLQYLIREYEAIQHNGTLPPCEDIGNNLCRLNLGVLDTDEASLETVNSIFVKSAEQTTGNLSSFKAKLSALCALADAQMFAFSAQELSDYLVIYEKEGYPMVSHSRTYRDAYHPAYRIILKKYATRMDIFAALDGLLRKKEHIVVAIDGNCGSGKTTLANLLGDIYDCNIVHMDDFFLPMELRTPERLSEPGGNVHYERFLAEAASGIKSGGGFTYRVFDCKTMDYGQSKTVEPKRITVVEGSYSMNPRLIDLYDLKIFTTCSAVEQDRRIRNRNGMGEMYQKFVKQWIPMENHYFNAFGIRENSDLIVDTKPD